MKRQQFALIISTLLIVTCLPWLAHSQMGGMGGGGMGGPQRGGGMGGMGGGMGGGMDGMGGGMGGMGGRIVPQEIVAYHRPAGPPPSWLTNGLASVKSTEELREELNETIFIESAQEKLTDLVSTLRDHNSGIEVEIDLKSIEEAGIDIEGCRGLPQGEGPLRELLIRTLDQQELAYRVLEHHIQITTKESAIANPTICYYDLAFVQSDSKFLAEIMNAIQTSIDPEHWSGNGGVGTIVPVGQLLVVRTDEASHQEVARMLARLSLTVSSETADGKKERVFE